MTQLLKNSDYINLGANDLVKKGAEVIKKEEEGDNKVKNEK
jgi:hypothetical protein